MVCRSIGVVLVFAAMTSVARGDESLPHWIWASDAATMGQ
jgi:hypothetical protein